MDVANQYKLLLVSQNVSLVNAGDMGECVRKILSLITTEASGNIKDVIIT